MRILYLSSAFIPLVILAACSAGERGMLSPHQPVVSAAGAAVPNCPDWSDKNRPPTDAQASNYGCATAVNLAAMLADPNDLLHGKSAGPGGVDTAVRAVRAWREIAPTAKQWEVSTKVSAKGGG